MGWRGGGVCCNCDPVTTLRQLGKQEVGCLWVTVGGAEGGLNPYASVRVVFTAAAAAAANRQYSFRARSACMLVSYLHAVQLHRCLVLCCAVQDVHLSARENNWGVHYRRGSWFLTYDL